MSKARPRVNRATGRWYTPKATVAYEDAIAWHTRSLRLRGPVSVSIVFYTRRHADLDNLAKAVLDGMQKGGGLENDSQVRRLNLALELPDDDGPRTEITALELV